MRGHWGLYSAAALVLASGPAWSQDDQSDPAANWQAIVACADQSDAERRHACMDGVLRTAGVLDPAREIAAQRQSFGEARRGEGGADEVGRTMADAPARAARPSAPHTPSAVPPPDLRELRTTVADALIGADRLLLVATAEGAVWKQVDGSPFRRPPAKGTEFSVEEGALGSYRCKIGSDIYRCRRID